MKNFYEAWISSLIGQASLTREALEAYQLKKLKETLAYVQDKSRFYREHLQGLKIDSLEDFSRIPFTSSDDLAQRSGDFLCLAQHEVARIISIETSGTKKAKRIFFSEEDLERTVDFFHHGMTYLVEAGDKVLVLMPGSSYASIGDLLKKGLARLGCQAFILGLSQSSEKVLETLVREEIDAIVGIPLELYQLARIKDSHKAYKDLKVKSILLSADYVADSVKKLLEESFGAKVFNHYGMSEMGYGGGLDSPALDGYHLREADLYFEIVDPNTGQVLPPGQEGEVVFTTLTRKAMPLVRYRTGDLASFVEDSKGPLKKMGHVRGRREEELDLDGHKISLAQLDEILFRLDGLLDYGASLNKEGILKLEIKSLQETNGVEEKEVKKALIEGGLGGLIDSGLLRLEASNQFVTREASSTLVKRLIKRED